MYKTGNSDHDKASNNLRGLSFLALAQQGLFFVPQNVAF